MRIILIPFFITAVVYARLDIAFVIFTIAIISDGADGFIARALKQQTQLGTILDPVADKLLLTARIYACLWWAPSRSTSDCLRTCRSSSYPGMSLSLWGRSLSMW